VLHADSGILQTEKCVVIVKAERFRETELESEEAFKN
jgi:hypothetical protein